MIIQSISGQNRAQKSALNSDLTQQDKQYNLLLKVKGLKSDRNSIT
jgi:hypothetical protein